MANKTAANIQFSDKTYDAVKKTVTVVLPALAALYFSIAQIWGLPSAEQVVGSIASLNLFLGVVMGISSKTYNNSDDKYDGAVQVITTEEGTRGGLLMNEGPEALLQKDEVRLKVDKK